MKPIQQVHSKRMINRDAIQHRKIIAIKSYQQNDLTSKQIADLAGVSPSTLTVWAKECEIPLRSRGRRRLIEPTVAHKQILFHAWHSTYESAASVFGKQRQSVWRLAKRWWIWAEREFGPRSINKLEEASQNAQPIKNNPTTVQPNVISFRVSDPILAGILKAGGDGQQFAGCSPHVVARSLLTRLLKDQQHEATPPVEHSAADYCI